MWNEIRTAGVASVALACGAAALIGCGDDSEDPPGAGAGSSQPTGGGMGTPSGTGGMGTPSGTGGMSATGMDASVVTMCGAVTCAQAERCVEGECRMPCTSDAACGDDSCCAGYCTDVEDDRDHCGACDAACESGLSCVGGECAMPMCSGEPGEPLPMGADWDAGVSDIDAGSAPDAVFGDNGCPANEVCADEGDGPQCMCGSEPGCPPDQRCEEGECMCGEGPGCDAGESCCEGSCFDLENDENNCGFCGRACAAGHSCTDGECGCPVEGERLCGGECVDTQSDETHCGRCGRECADGASCVSGRCECDEPGQIACGGVCVDGETNENCGECGNACEAPSTCRDPNGSRPLGCWCPNVNEVPCEGVCVALGTTDNCGSCGDSCEAPADVCREGSCQCPVEGETPCGDSCVDLATGTDSDPGDGTLFEHCGMCDLTCLPDAECSAGVCSCPTASTTDLYCDEDSTGATDGDYACIEVTTTRNCGACGNACIDDSECRESGDGDSPDDFDCVCIGDDSGRTHCPGAGCRSLDDDPEHCGDCGAACEEGEECCDGGCVDPDSYDDDRDNCGECGNQCADFGCGFLGFEACDCIQGQCET